MKVLVVDDSAIMRKVIAQILEMLGHDSVPASNGIDAFDRLKEHEDVRLILLDWNMPEMNGIEFLREIKGRQKLAEIPVIMLTTESERRKMIEAIEAGAKHYLTKPFQPETLATKILQCAGGGA
ncbi:MAG: response regulator [Deltaproteobacteria bacterium]|nr:response regulator [Deltaproteobacteria bacterium]